MKKNLILIAICLIFSIGAVAQNQTKEADIKTLLRLMQSDKMIDSMTDNMLTMLKQQAQTEMKGEKERATFEAYSDFLIQETRALSKKLIDVESVNIYDKHLTHDEIKDLIKFYESPTGKKLLEVMPQITTELMQAMSESHLPEFQSKMKAKMQELFQKEAPLE